MPKIKTTLNNVFELFTPQIDDPKGYISQNTELIVRADEDAIKVGLPDGTINEFVDPSIMLGLASTATLHPGTVAGTGAIPYVELSPVVSVGGASRLAKPLASKRGHYAIAPFGLVFTSVASNYADAQFTGAVSDAYPTLTGDPLKAAAFIAFESRLTRAVANALNRELDFSSGNTQSVRIAQLFCYERDLLWLQEVVNGVARVLGWYEFANKYAILDPALSSTGILQDPEFYSRIKTIARITAQFKTIDPDTHATMQFLNDYHIVEKDNMRCPTVTKDSVCIHVPFCANGALVENVTNATPLPFRITTTELNQVHSYSGNAYHVYDLMTNDWTEVLIYGVTKAKALAALDEVIILAHGIIENYKEVLKYLNTIEGKKIATLNSMSEFLYFDGNNVTPVQPYYSYEERALKQGAPMIINVEGVAPVMYAKCLIDFTTGGTFTSNTRLQANYLSNFAEWGIDLNEKTDNLQEYFWQVWVPYAYASEAASDINTDYRFVNPFNGLCYTPQTPFPYVIAATSVSILHNDMDMGGTVNVGFVHITVAASKTYPAIFTRSDTSYYTGVIALSLNSATFGSPTTDTKQEKHDGLRTQEYVQRIAFALRNYYFSSKNTASEVGVFGVKAHTVRSDNFLLPISNQYFAKHCSSYYAEMYPTINFTKSVSSQK